MELSNLTFQQAVAMHKELCGAMATSIDTHIEEISELIQNAIYSYAQSILQDIMRNAFHELGWTTPQDFDIPMSPACVYNMEYFNQNKSDQTKAPCGACPLNFIEDCNHYVNKIVNGLLMYALLDLCQQNEFAGRTSLMKNYLEDAIKTLGVMSEIPVRQTTELDLTEPYTGGKTNDE